MGHDETRKTLGERSPRTHDVPSRASARGLIVRGGRGAFAALRLLPIQRALRELERHGMDVGSLRALEVFGFTGERLTRYYADRVRSLDVWEIEPQFEPVLRRKFPRARIMITDSFAEVRRTDQTWDLVVIDNPIWPGEHFDLFPAVFRVLSDRSALVIRVLSEFTAFTAQRYPGAMDAEHSRRRRDFYGTTHAKRLHIDDVVEHYQRLASEHGLTSAFHHVIHLREFDGLRLRRSGFGFLVLGLERTLLAATPLAHGGADPTAMRQ